MPTTVKFYYNRIKIKMAINKET